MHAVIMVMGMSGSGKSTVGIALAETWGGVFLDGDDYHPQVNVDHMAAGHPLTDEMRWPWLDALAQSVNANRREAITVFACSALRKTYRDALRSAIPDLIVAYLEAPYDVVAQRLSQRSNHYMPAALLDSQYAALEPPVNPAMSVSIDQPLQSIVAKLKTLV